MSHYIGLPEGSFMSKFLCGLAAGALVLALAVAGRGDDADVAKDLVAKAIKASGGAARVASLKAGTCKAKVNLKMGDQQITATLDITWQGLDKYRIDFTGDIAGMTKNALVVINGAEAWAKDSDRNKVEKAPKDAASMITGALYALRMPHLLPALLDKEVKLSPLGEIKIGDRAALGVTVTHPDRKDVSLFFDKETGLPSKSEIRVTDPRGMEMTFEFLYHDYKDSEGLKSPTRIAIKADKIDTVMEVSDLKAESKIEAGLFAAPE